MAGISSHKAFNPVMSDWSEGHLSETPGIAGTGLSGSGKCR